MKNRFLYFVISAALSLVSCSKENSITAFHPDEGEIFFGTVGVSGLTKAVSESTVSTLQENGFKAAVVLDKDKTVMFNSALAYNAGYYSVQGEKYYYLDTGTISAYAVYPINEVIEVNSGVATIAYNQNPVEDLIVAKAEGVAKQDEAIGLDFEHVLSQVLIKCKGKDSGVDYVLKNIEIIAPESGTYQFGSGEWADIGTQTSYTYYTNDGETVSTENYQSVGESMTFIPGQVKLRVVYECKNKYDNSLLASYDQTVSVPVKSGERTTLNLLLPNNDVDGFQFTVSVSSWSEEESEIEVVDKSPVFKVNDSGKSIRFAEGFLYWDNAGRCFSIEESIFNFSDIRDENHLNVFRFNRNAQAAVYLHFPEGDKKRNDLLFAADGGAVAGYSVLTEKEWRYLLGRYLVKTTSDDYAFMVDGRKGIILSVDGNDGAKPKDNYTLEEWETVRTGKYFFIPYSSNNGMEFTAWTGSADIDDPELARMISITSSHIDFITAQRGSPKKILLNKELN